MLTLSRLPLQSMIYRTFSSSYRASAIDKGIQEIVTRRLEKLNGDLRKYEFEKNKIFFRKSHLEKNIPVKYPLGSSMLPVEIPSEIRESICKTYNMLRKKQNLDVLELSPDVLFKYYGSEEFFALDEIEECAKEYMDKSTDFHYGAVLRYVRLLKKNDLRPLLDDVLENEFQQLSSQEDFTREEKNGVIETLEILAKEYSDFPVGDFSFIPNGRWKCRSWIIVAYKECLASGTLDLLREAREIEANESALEYCESIGLSNVMDRINATSGHTGFTMSFVMHQMYQIARLSWEDYVKKNLDDLKEIYSKKIE